jgi:hypothetical protein
MMGPIGKFRKEERGSVSLDMLEVGAGSVTLAIMAVYAILSGSPVTPDDHASDRADWTSNGATGSAVLLSGIDALPLNERVLLPVGSVAVHSDSALTVFETPSGGWIDAWSRDGKPVPVGTVLTSLDNFELPDGSSIDASTFAASISEAYGSSVKYAFD